MKIKDYKCKCGHNDFFFADKGNQKGIYCAYCGKWLKWADKDEQNLAMKQEPFINKPCVSGEVCEHDKQKVLDKIRAEIEKWHKEGTNWSDLRLMKIEDILDKYKGESEG